MGINLATPAVSLHKTLKLRHIVIMGLAYLTPMTVFDSFVIVSDKTHGHVPSAYILALVAILFTALSYATLVRQFPHSGSAYSYVNHSIGKHIGFMVGWLSLMDYVLLPMINVLLVAIYLTALFPTVPHWVWVVAGVVLMTGANIFQINWVANLNTCLVVGQIIILIVFIYLVWSSLSQSATDLSGLTWEPFYSKQMSFFPLLSGAAILCFSFLGFDAVTTLSEETHSPDRVIPRAIILTALYGGMIFIVISYCIQRYFPDSSLLNDPDASLPDIAFYVGGRLWQVVMLLFAVVGALASGIASQASIARLLYVMGRNGVFSPHLFGYIHPRLHTPIFNVLLVGLVALLALFLNLESAMTLINFGALIAFTFVNLSVINYFCLRKGYYRSYRDRIRYFILPLIGTLLIAGLWLGLDHIALLCGIGWGLIGLGYLAYLTRGFRHPPPQLRETVYPDSE